MRRAFLALVFVALAPFALGYAPAEIPLESASVATPAGPCVPAFFAPATAPGYVSLSWTHCAGASSYQVLRGPSAAELVPLATVNHAGHIDVDVRAGALYVYAVRADAGPLSQALVVTT